MGAHLDKRSADTLHLQAGLSFHGSKIAEPPLDLLH